MTKDEFSQWTYKQFGMDGEKSDEIYEELMCSKNLNKLGWASLDQLDECISQDNVRYVQTYLKNVIEDYY